MDQEKRKKLNDKARAILQEAGLDPDCVWKTQLSIDDIMLQPGLSDNDANGIVKALENDPSGSIHALRKGLYSGIMNDWHVVAAVAAQELAAEAR